MNWLVYMLECSDNSIYTGITNNLEERLKTHQSGNGAKYLRGRLSEAQHESEKQVVDINKLLNREKIDKKNETKRKIIFYSFIIMGLSLFAALITFLK